MRRQKMDHPVKVGARKVSDAYYSKIAFRQDFQMPDGSIRDFLLWTSEHGDGQEPGETIVPSIVFPLTTDQKVVVVVQYRFGADQYIVELPGGCPRPGQNRLDVAKEELTEETGYRAGSMSTLGSSIWFEPANCGVPYQPVFAAACRKADEASPDETEFITPMAIPIDQWIRLVTRQEKLVFKGSQLTVSDSKTIAVTTLALAHLGYQFRLG
jgi:8-oxo-dGTP pyrophosphatase MutT (NUDIX family)